MNELGEKNIIAAVRTEAELTAALQSGVGCIFLLCSSILTLGDWLKKAHAAGKKVFIHLDMSEGIGRDNAGVSYVAGLGVDGIISTRTSIIRAAREMGLPAVQRVFSIDSQAIQVSTAAHPSYIEVMPGVIPKVIRRFCATTAVPIIAGGLIETDEEVAAALASGAVAVSTANQGLWK